MASRRPGYSCGDSAGLGGKNPRTGFPFHPGFTPGTFTDSGWLAPDSRI
jgi:hypothetical protein